MLVSLVAAVAAGVVAQIELPPPLRRPVRRRAMRREAAEDGDVARLEIEHHAGRVHRVVRQLMVLAVLRREIALLVISGETSVAPLSASAASMATITVMNDSETSRRYSPGAACSPRASGLKISLSLKRQRARRRRADDVEDRGSRAVRRRPGQVDHRVEAVEAALPGVSTWSKVISIKWVSLRCA